MRLVPFSVLLLCQLLVVHDGAAETPEEKGYRIASASAANDRSIEQYTASGTLILERGPAPNSESKFDLKKLHLPGGEIRLLFVFSSPDEISGVSLLVHSHPVEDDELWLFLPTNGRTPG